jgi:hypothetical protein
MATGIFIKTFTKPDKTGYNGYICNSDSEMMGILSDLWDNRTHLNSQDLKNLRYISQKQDWQTTKVKIK